MKRIDPYRILVIDDNASIHNDFKKILCAAHDDSSQLAEAEAALFGEANLETEPVLPGFEIDSAYQGEEGLAMVKMAVKIGQPYALAFVDMRMPPGWDGIETIDVLWKEDPALQVVICTAFSDHSWDEMAQRLGRTDRLLILKKPFDTIEARQLACALTEKWNLARQLNAHVRSLEARIAARTSELAQSLSLTRATIESTADGILVLDGDGKVVGFNKKFLNMWNVSHDDIQKLNRTQFRALAQSQLKDPEKYLERNHESDASPEGVFSDILAFKDGRFIERYLQPQKLDDTVVGEVFSFRDITAQTRSELALRESEKNLRQAQKMEAVGNLAGGIAHDFNNLLTVILGRSELLLTRLKGEDPSRRDIELIRTTGTRAATLTRQLLAFSRRQVLEAKVIDLNTIVSEMEIMLKRLIPENIELKTLLKSDLKNVRVDPGQIEQVIMNLVLNSRDAVPQGGKVTVETANVELDSDYLEAHSFAKSGEYVMLAVSDNGCGMDAELKSHIFEPFFTTKPKDKGTGLGLSTVYGIVKQSDGHIEVYSEVGIGTTFKVYLPMAKEDVQTPHMSALRPAVSSNQEVILLADDEDEVRSLVFDLLESNGYKVLTARNGIEAEENAERYGGSIQLLITDVVMPGMSGPELASRITSRYPKAKVLFMSGYTDDAVIHNGALTAGLNYLQKPFTPNNLLKKVCEILKNTAIQVPVA